MRNMAIFSRGTSQWKIGIAFSGGGARCIAHLGVLKALEDAGIRPSIVSGTSMGAILGALYANGISTEDILEEIEKINFVGLLRQLKLRSKTGLMSLGRFRSLLHGYLGEKGFDELSIPFWVSVANLNTGKNELFSEGPLIDLLLASASIPILFETVVINGQHYVDGGLFNNLPIEVIKESCDIAIGVHVNEMQDIQDLKSVAYTIDRVVSLSVYQNVLQSKKMCDIVIEPRNVRKYPIFAFGKAREIYEIGYDTGCKAVPDIFKLMQGGKFTFGMKKLFRKG